MTFLLVKYFIVGPHHIVLLLKTLMTFLTFVAEQFHVVLLAVGLSFSYETGLGLVQELLTLIALHSNN